MPTERSTTWVRIAIAGLAHEALTFFPQSTRMTDFDLWEGDEILD